MTSHDVSDHQLPRGAGEAADVPPIPAASVLLLREPASGGSFDVLMIRRHSNSSFVPDAWVFPGGGVDAADRELGDGSELSTMRVAAVRELFEETGIFLGATIPDADARRRELLAGETAFATIVRNASLRLDDLVWTSRWITPVGVPKRFDTWFFLAAAPDDAVASVENVEAVEHVWISPAQAMETLQLVFPTLKNLEAIAGYASIEELLASRRGLDVKTTRPVLVIENGRKKIILP